MKLIESKQKDVQFVFCPSPITIDKSAEWGPENEQKGPNGGFLKMNSATEVSHLVQPNADKSAPIGWIPGSGPGLFTKVPIWVDEDVLLVGEIVHIDTADGPLDYLVKEPSMVCYNSDANGPDLKDGWVQTIKNLTKNYNLQGVLTPA